MPSASNSSFGVGRRMLPAIVALGCLAAFLISNSASPSVQADHAGTLSVAAPRVVVLKSKRMLHLFDGDQLLRSYPIDLGLQPTGDKRLRDDGRTPEGQFRIVTKNPGSPYYRFLGIDYPDLDAVANGLASGLLTLGEVVAIARAHAAGACPDWSTLLGGGIGIHGHRRGRDWTAGCIALADEHVAELFGVLRIGDPVEILP